MLPGGQLVFQIARYDADVDEDNESEWEVATSLPPCLVMSWGWFLSLWPLPENQRIDILPETNIAPENGWLEYKPFLLERPIFRGYVSFRESIPNCHGWKEIPFQNHHFANISSRKRTWLAGKSTMNWVDVFPIEHGDFPASHLGFHIFHGNLRGPPQEIRPY